MSVRDRWPAQGRFVTIGDGRQVHVIERGEGRPILLVHGASSNARDLMFALGDRLEPHGRVIAFDRPGLGWSDPLPDRERLQGHADAIAQLIAAERLERPVVVAHSYGGAISLRLALDHPDAVGGLVLIGAPSTSYVGPVAWYNYVSNTPVAGTLFNRAVMPLVAPGRLESGLVAGFAPDPVPDGYVENVGPQLAFRPVNFASNARDLARANRELAQQDTRYGELRMPIAIIAGDRDSTVYTSRHSEVLAAQAADTRLAVLPGVGHMPHYAAPDLVVEHVLAIVEAADRDH